MKNLKFKIKNKLNLFIIAVTLFLISCENRTQIDNSLCGTNDFKYYTDLKVYFKNVS